MSYSAVTGSSSSSSSESSWGCAEGFGGDVGAAVGGALDAVGGC